MNIYVRRKYFTDASTVGELYLEDDFFSYTLEDTVREGPKISGKTAIPKGKYEVVIDQSTRFKKRMPHLLDVPNFEGVRIHAGNTDADTEGCLLIGQYDPKIPDFVSNSRALFGKFFVQLDDILKKEKVYIEIL